MQNSKLNWQHIFPWPWVFRRLPFRRCESCLSIKYSSSFPRMPRQSIMPLFNGPIIVFISWWPWTLLDLRESLSIRINLSESCIFILTYFMPAALVLQIDGFIGRWSWSKITGSFDGVYIDCFRSNGKLLAHKCIHLILILNYSQKYPPRSRILLYLRHYIRSFWRFLPGTAERDAFGVVVEHGLDVILRRWWILWFPKDICLFAVTHSRLSLG